MAEKKRLANIELLRILAMAMIVTMHFLRESGCLVTPGEDASLIMLTGTVLECFCIVAVNVYVLVSGYFYRSEFPKEETGAVQSYVGKLFRFLCRIWFYALTAGLVLTLLGEETLLQTKGLYGLLAYLLPIESETYWFAGAFFLLLLVKPLLDRAVTLLDKPMLQGVLAGLLLIFCLIKSICPVHLPMDKYGYDFGWFICVYLTGAYLKKYGFGLLKKGLPVYLACCAVSALWAAGVWRLSLKWSGLGYFSTLPYHYNFLLCYLGAIGLFGCFLQINLKEGKGACLIRLLGKWSFGIYLFHEHPDLRSRWYPWLHGLLFPGREAELPVLAIELPVSLLLIFSAGFLLEWCRSGLFTLFERKADQ